MKNKILYVIGVAFALVLMVFFSGFFRNVDFFPAEPKIMNGKTILIETFNDKKADKYWKSQFIRLYENSDFKPTDEMFDNASLCFKEEVFENIINNESEEYQKILESEIKIETKDQLALESKDILSEFQGDFQDAVVFCKEKHIKDKNKDVFLECDTVYTEVSYPSLSEERGSTKTFLSFNTTEVPFRLKLWGNTDYEWTFKSCEIEYSDVFDESVKCSFKLGNNYDVSLNLSRNTGLFEYEMMYFDDGSGLRRKLDGVCSESQEKNIF